MASKPYIKASEAVVFPNPWEQFWDDPSLFQHNWAQSIKTWMRGFGAEELDWPPHTPDLHSREHFWDELKQRLIARPHHPESVTDGFWKNIPINTLLNLVESLPRRVEVATSTVNLTNGELDVIKVHVPRKSDILILWQCSFWKHNQCSTAWTTLDMVPALVFHCWNKTLQHPEQDTSSVPPDTKQPFIPQCHFLNVAFDQVLNNWIHS